MTAVDHPNISAPFIAVMGPSNRATRLTWINDERVCVKRSDGRLLFFVPDARATRTTTVITKACIVMLQTLTIPPTRNWISMTMTTL